MRVLYVHTATQPPLGADTWIHAQIIRHLDRAGHEVYVACRTTFDGAPTPTYEAIRNAPDTTIVPVNLGTELGGGSLRQKVRGLVATLPAVPGLVRLFALVRRRRIRIIHTSDRPRDAFAAVVVGRLTGARSIVHVHVGYNPAWMGWMLRWSLAHADALIAISEYVASTLVDGGHARQRVHVVLNGIDMAAWVPDVGGEVVRAELGFADSTPVVVTVCRLFPEKGPGELIQALARVRETLPDAQLLVVGHAVTPGYAEELEALAAELDVAGAVHFLGRRPDVPAIMDAADIFAMPSHEEPFGLVFVEAMAMRRPVVAVADGGTLEVVEHERTGLLSAWHDVDQLTADLTALLQDPARREAMGTAGRGRAEACFTVQRMAADVARCYPLVASPGA